MDKNHLIVVPRASPKTVSANSAEDNPTTVITDVASHVRMSGAMYPQALLPPVLPGGGVTWWSSGD